MYVGHVIMAPLNISLTTMGLAIKDIILCTRPNNMVMLDAVIVEWVESRHHNEHYVFGM